jgi:hypothetical protein
LFDPEGRLDALKRRVANYPTPLRRAIVRDFLWSAEFDLAAFAPKYASRSGTYGTAACLTRAVHELLLDLFALNRRARGRLAALARTPSVTAARRRRSSPGKKHRPLELPPQRLAASTARHLNASPQVHPKARKAGITPRLAFEPW